MYQNTFETLAVETTLFSRQTIENLTWKEIGCFFIRNYMEQLGKTPNAVIGHIKGLIELEDENFIKLSSVRADRPVNAEIPKTHGNSREGRLTFNGIISNISKDTNIQCFHMALERTCSVYGLTTDYKEAIPGDEETTNSNPEPCPVCHEHHPHDETCGHHH
ncbi:hypothetical protein [Acetobacterium bakii]|uniref:Uncharacterized protein n=1 Tax=Acetobacterium bakii TaxID=52689 RepID=A0A0L6U1A9_9FIRM|nr:hypothetical protein [Acetobacterium bakii]KNZ42288.1 hypothetical protein AKG39_07170 [Acetobacterium bakii]